MECIEARALKSSFLSGKSTTYLHHHQGGGAYYDELLSVAGGINNVVVNSEDFSVDDLLDFSDKNINGSDYSEEDEEEKDSFSVSSRDYDVNSNSSAFSGDGMLGSLPAGELIVPEDEMENLEWLSQLVDDSGPDSLCLPPPAAGSFEEKTGRLTMNRFSVPRPEVRECSVLGFSYPVPRRARTQRSRLSRRVWPIGSFSLVESSSTSSSSIDSSVTSPVSFTNPVQVMDSFWAFGKPPAKKQKKTPSTEASGSGISGSQMQRRCSHCGVQKTPQWRTGPLGPKTLCNACGVRFKSGRLFPEYRPACSPTFSIEAHSNSHRKVLEMRRKKEMSEMGSMSEPGLAQMVPSF